MTVERERLGRRPHESEVAVHSQEVQILVDVVFGDGVQDEVEAACVFLYLVRVLGNHHLVGAESQGIFHLVG